MQGAGNPTTQFLPRGGGGFIPHRVGERGSTRSPPPDGCVLCRGATQLRSSHGGGVLSLAHKAASSGGNHVPGNLIRRGGRWVRWRRGRLPKLGFRGWGGKEGGRARRFAFGAGSGLGLVVSLQIPPTKGAYEGLQGSRKELERDKTSFPP